MESALLGVKSQCDFQKKHNCSPPLCFRKAQCHFFFLVGTCHQRFLLCTKKKLCMFSMPCKTIESELYENWVCAQLRLERGPYSNKTPLPSAWEDTNTFHWALCNAKSGCWKCSKHGFFVIGFDCFDRHIQSHKIPFIEHCVMQKVVDSVQNMVFCL